MSYILDAINKSDRERKIRQGPNLAEAYQGARYPRAQPRLWSPLTALLLLILLCGTLCGLYLAGLKIAGFSDAGVRGGGVDDPAAAEVLGGDLVPPFDAVAERWQLPDALRRELPPLEFTLHVYSELPQQRSIIINHRMMREGEALEPDLSLQAITEEGVIMLFHSEYFRVRIVENWEE